MLRQGLKLFSRSNILTRKVSTVTPHGQIVFNLKNKSKSSRKVSEATALNYFENQEKIHAPAYVGRAYNRPLDQKIDSFEDLKEIRASKENDFIHNYLHKRLTGYKSIASDINSLAIVEKLNRLRLLESDTIQNESEIRDLMDSIKSDINIMNQQELAALLLHVKDEKSRWWTRIKRLIDLELRWLLKQHVRTRLMDLDLWLYLADIFYQIRINSKFAQVLTFYLTHENDIELNESQLMHLLFLMIVQKKHGNTLAQHEDRLIDIAKRGSLQDISTICMAYFKTKTVITNLQLLRAIIERTTKLIPNIDPNLPGYCSIVKSIRYSRHSELRDPVERLINQVQKGGNHPDEAILFASTYNAIHTLKLTEAFRIYDKKLLDRIAKCVFENLDSFRIKDLQYALTSLSNMAYNNLKLDKETIQSFDKICADIVTESRIDSDYQNVHLLPLLRAFAIFGYYNDELLCYTNTLLSNPNYLDSLKNVFEYDRSALLLYVAEKLDGNRNFLNNTAIFKKISEDMNRSGNSGVVSNHSSLHDLSRIIENRSSDKNLVFSRMFKDIATSLANRMEFQDSSYMMAFQFTFPHQNFADLVISKDCKTPGGFKASDLSLTRVPDGEKHCLLYATKINDYTDGFSRLSGYKQLMIRLYEKLGYSVVTVDLVEPNIDQVSQSIRKVLNSGLSYK